MLQKWSKVKLYDKTITLYTTVVDTISNEGFLILLRHITATARCGLLLQME